MVANRFSTAVPRRGGSVLFAPPGGFRGPFPGQPRIEVGALTCEALRTVWPFCFVGLEFKAARDTGPPPFLWSAQSGTSEERRASKHYLNQAFQHTWQPFEAAVKGGPRDGVLGFAWLGKENLPARSRQVLVQVHLGQFRLHQILPVILDDVHQRRPIGLKNIV